MSRRALLFSVALLGFTLSVLAFSPATFAQEDAVPQAGCSALDKSKPPLFISYENPADKAWAGDKYEKGVRLRLSNNSNCSIIVSAAYDQTPSFIFKDGKLSFRKLTDKRFDSLTNGQQVSLVYLIKYPEQKYLVMGGFGGDLLDSLWLNGGDYVFFSVPLKNFKKGGELLLQYNYAWEDGEVSQIVTEEDGYKQRYETVEHHLRFDPHRLPKEILK
jgi:hypothetical protein